MLCRSSLGGLGSQARERVINTFINYLTLHPLPTGKKGSHREGIHHPREYDGEKVVTKIILKE